MGPGHGRLGPGWRHRGRCGRRSAGLRNPGRSGQAWHMSGPRARGGNPLASRNAIMRSRAARAFGPIGTSSASSGATFGCLRNASNMLWTAVLQASCHVIVLSLAMSNSTDPNTRSTTWATRSARPVKCRYSVAVPESSRWASVRIDRASAPSSSTICSAVETIRSTAMGGRPGDRRCLVVTWQVWRLLTAIAITATLYPIIIG